MVRCGIGTLNFLGDLVKMTSCGVYLAVSACVSQCGVLMGAEQLRVTGSDACRQPVKTVA